MSKKRKAANQPSLAPPLADDEITIRPYWDKALHELWVGPILVKTAFIWQWAVSAAALHALLAAAVHTGELTAAR